MSYFFGKLRATYSVNHVLPERQILCYKFGKLYSTVWLNLCLPSR